MKFSERKTGLVVFGGVWSTPRILSIILREI
jgi:hypothetical protein